MKTFEPRASIKIVMDRVQISVAKELLDGSDQESVSFHGSFKAFLFRVRNKTPLQEAVDAFNRVGRIQEAIRILVNMGIAKFLDRSDADHMMVQLMVRRIHNP